MARRSDHRRRGAGAGGAAAAGRGAGRGARPGARFVLLEDLIAMHVGRAVPRLPGRQLQRLPGHPQLRPHHRRGRGRGPAEDDPGGAAPARPRQRRAAGDRRSDTPARRAGASCARRCAWSTTTSTRVDGPLHLADLRAARTAATSCASSRDEPFVPQDAPALRDADDMFAAIGRARHPAAPPLRVVRPRGRLHRRGGRRPERAGHQADALPHQRRLARSSGRWCARPRTASR